MSQGMSAARTARASLRVTRWFLAMLRNGRLPAGLLAIAVGVALAVLVTDQHFVVRDVVVKGIVTVSGPTLAETSGVLGRGVFGVDARAVALRVAGLPAVQHVDVYTETPDRLVIRVVERQAAIIWDTGQTVFVLDRDGTVLSRVDGAMPDLPKVRVLAAGPIAVGERVSPLAVRSALSVLDRLPAEGGVSRAAIVIDPIIGVIVQTESWNAIVGTDEQLGEKLAVLKVLLTRNPTWTEIDLRDPTRIAFHGATTPTAAVTPLVRAGTGTVTRPTATAAR